MAAMDDNERVAHLILKRQWYDMIGSGEKTEEYRDYSPHWRTRLLDFREIYDIGKDDILVGFPESWLTTKEFNGLTPVARHRFVAFACGYRKESMRFRIKGMRIGRGKPEWGAPTDKDVIIIQLGKRVCGYEEADRYFEDISKQKEI